MGTGMLAGFEGVPIPGGAACVVAGQFAESEGWRVVPLGRKRDQRRGVAERQGEVHNPQADGIEFFDQAQKSFRHDGPLKQTTESICRTAKKQTCIASARFGREGLDVAAELETVFEQTQIGDEGFWPGSFDLRDDGLQTFAGDGAASGSGEVVDSADGASLRDAGGASDAFQVGAGARGGGKSADREKALVVKNNVNEIFWFVTRESTQGTEVHEERAVAIEDYDFLMRLAEREAKAGG